MLGFMLDYIFEDLPEMVMLMEMEVAFLVECDFGWISSWKIITLVGFGKENISYVDIGSWNKWFDDDVICVKTICLIIGDH